MAGVVFGMIEGRERGWTSFAVLGAFASGAVLLAAFVVAERRHPLPLVDLGVLRLRRFAAANLTGVSLHFVMLGTTVYLSAFLQGEHDISALEAGLALLPMGGAVAVLAPLSGRATAWVSPRTLMAGGQICTCVGALLLSGISPSDGALDIVPALVLLGVGVGGALPAATVVAISSVPAHQTGMASAIHNASRQVGATLGVAVLGSIVFAGDSLADGLGTASLVAAGLVAAATVASLALVRASSAP
jgi:DHA2 family methylenomycin A resistance protein-like MFS transporter